MTSGLRNTIVALVFAVTAGIALSLAGTVLAGEPPVKQIVTGHYGWEVDKSTKGPICTVTSGHECQPGVASSQPGGFGEEGLPTSIAGAASSSDIYVVDGGNHRVQELKANGEFVAMIGWDVNKTKVGEGAPQVQRNLCTRESGDACGAGVAGTLPGQFSRLLSVAVDPEDGNLYVAELNPQTGGRRVQELTSSGQFVLEIGKEVNETTRANLCTEEEVEKTGVKCTGPTRIRGGARNPGEFAYGESGELLAAGGPEDLLYVGDEHAVQEFRANGTWAGEPLVKSEAISQRLTELSPEPESQVRDLTVDQAGNVYLVYVLIQGEPGSVIRVFDASGRETKSLTPNDAIVDIALDSAGRLAVSGSLYEIAGTGLHLITHFATQGENDLAFNNKGEMFATGAAREVVAYEPVLVGELITGSSGCEPGTVLGTNVTLNCKLEGEVNPLGVTETGVWFEWGDTPALGNKTPTQVICTTICESTPVKVSAQLQGLVPNQALYYRFAGSDAVVLAPEILTGELMSFVTQSVPPRIVGEPSVGFVRFANAVMSAHLNPEHTNTNYEFQYAPAAECASLQEEKTCKGIGQSKTAQSAAYASIHTILEASGLQPSTLYRYRLTATNNKGETALNENGETQIPEGTFTTAPAPVPVAETGNANVTGPTSAIISGLANPDGQPATYTFEIGIDAGPNTQYGTVLTGPAGTGNTPVPESFNLSGLQPSTTYTFRIKVTSGYGTAYGQPTKFTTTGQPTVLTVPGALAILETPTIKFPTQPCKHGYKQNKHNKCVKNKPKKKPKKRRKTKP